MVCIHHTKMNGILSMAMLMSYGISDILKRCGTASLDITAPTHVGINVVSQWTSTKSWTGIIFYIQNVVKLLVLRLSAWSISEIMKEIA